MGNIEKRGENKYRLTVSAGFKPDGSRQYIRKTITAKSEREAGKKLALFMAEVENSKIRYAQCKYTSGNRGHEANRYKARNAA